MELTNSRNRFYLNFAVGLFLIGFLGFGINGLVNPEKLPPQIPIVSIHAFFMFSWLILTPIQLYLSAKNNSKRIKAFQTIALAIVVGMVITIFLMTAFRYQRKPDLVLDATFNLFTIFNFLILIGLGSYHRVSVALYNRILLLASLSIILPGLKRLLRVFLWEENLAFLLLLLLFVLVALNDRKVEKKIHKYTRLSAYLSVQSVVLSLVLSGLDFWKKGIHDVMNFIEIY